MTRRNVRRIEAALVLIPALLFAGYGVVKMLRYRNALVVWSCGGNYESLKEYARAFERREGVVVRYTAAPVTYLLDKSLESESPPDVIVGRGGPGWLALRKAGKLGRGPVFFALDPLVIAVRLGNPKDIQTLDDLGRSGIRVSYSPLAMRPKSKVPALLMAAVSAKYSPGLVERWENNMVSASKCGRKALEPLLADEADAALVPRTLLYYPPYKGKLDFVPVQAKYILAMKKGRPSMPQCAGVLKTGRGERQAALASQFVDGLVQDEKWLESNGYLCLADPEAKPLQDLLKISAPKDMAGWQCHMALRLEQCGVLHEARRRWLKVFHTFGPSHYGARALYQCGALNARMGAIDAGREDWNKVLALYPPAGPLEYDSKGLASAALPVPVKRLPYGHWVDAARGGLNSHAAAGDGHARVLEDPLFRLHFPVEVTDGDPPKNGKRELGLGLHLMAAGDYEFATRDLLKVVALNHPSRFMPLAEYLLGICARQRGLPPVAAVQWNRVIREFPGTAEALEAAKRLAEMGEAQDVEDFPESDMPPWVEKYSTHGARSMTYGMRLYKHRMPLFAFKEMVKILSGVYGAHKLGAEARYRAGVAARALGNPPAAAVQWKICRGMAPESRWGKLSGARLAEGSAQATPVEPLGKPKKNPTGKRFQIAEEFRRAGVYEQDQIILEYLKVLTVARPGKPGKAKAILAAASYHLGECLERKGASAEALKQFGAVCEEFSDTKWAKLAAAAKQRIQIATKTSGEK
ncbi:MAG: substrate-binding domain-containing protein [Lentisphaeria bacterium]|nr:substrate-binding domain-containing protein [Lentisphaeria bacterium]